MDANQPQQTNQVNNPTQTQPQTVPVVGQPQQQPVINNNVANNNVNITNNAQSRKIASMNVNGNNYGINNGINNDDAKQPDIVNTTQQTSAQQASTETEMKVSSLYGDANGTGQGPQQQQAGGVQQAGPRRTKPPVRQSNSNTASLSIPAQAQTQAQTTPQVQVQTGPRNASQIVQSPHQNAPPQRIVQQRKPKKIVVNRHKYKYEGRGFDIWTRNLKRPIYTSTTIKINKTFGKNEKAIRNFLQQKGGLREALIEQVTFIDPKKNANNQRGGRGRNNNGGDNRPMKPFTIVRVRTSLTNIKNVVDRIKNHPDLTKENSNTDGQDFIRKQNNRTRIENRNGTSNKLYINNFDILDKNTHWELTKIFLRFGELEQDIFIGRDKRQNPYAFVVYRTREAAKRCIQQHTRRETAIYFPPKQKDNDNDNDYQTGSPSNRIYLNRKLHIEYNVSKDDNNSGGYNNEDQIEDQIEDQTEVDEVAEVDVDKEEDDK
eukprot:CAMPEP_0201568510 /NCGR_PEP_ID=MMETSP0190_2-20130828/9627_1 /ASSEMBLY_ACC=CAM_ASM_000263 /TAXON_ID=37353 /ORGANISM="Rosalina sp." /LENGTH=488 /DNA_ID=CAMNT_0047989709 /DNA_START=368 /DNA_END=1835 /DNA_ORIENTATION=-